MGLRALSEMVCWQHPSFPALFLPWLFVYLVFCFFPREFRVCIFLKMSDFSKTSLYSINNDFFSDCYIPISLLISSALILFFFNELTTGLSVLFILPFLKQQALSLPLRDGPWAESYCTISIKHCLEAPLWESWAFQVCYLIALISLTAAKAFGY